mmetsp:Transcript_54549/g.119351  ORF Transcript_54549/g.119351 Transcript_54549/m.119351 type:complete len:343 (-) Transcript_54549:1715-2743(-)
MKFVHAAVDVHQSLFELSDRRIHPADHARNHSDDRPRNADTLAFLPRLHEPFGDLEAHLVGHFSKHGVSHLVVRLAQHRDLLAQGCLRHRAVPVWPFSVEDADGDLGHGSSDDVDVRSLLVGGVLRGALLPFDDVPFRQVPQLVCHRGTGLLHFLGVAIAIVHKLLDPGSLVFEALLGDAAPELRVHRELLGLLEQWPCQVLQESGPILDRGPGKRKLFEELLSLLGVQKLAHFEALRQGITGAIPIGVPGPNSREDGDQIAEDSDHQVAGGHCDFLPELQLLLVLRKVNRLGEVDDSHVDSLLSHTCHFQLLVSAFCIICQGLRIWPPGQEAPVGLPETSH